jgi:hypothetical protein
MADRYDDNWMSQRKVYGWVERSRRWRTNVDNACSGRSSTVKFEEVNEQIDQHIRDNRRIKVDLITSSGMKMMSWKKRYKNYISSNWQHFIVMGWGNLRTFGPSALEIRTSTYGNKICLSCLHYHVETYKLSLNFIYLRLLW